MISLNSLILRCQHFNCFFKFLDVLFHSINLFAKDLFFLIIFLFFIYGLCPATMLGQFRQFVRVTQSKHKLVFTFWGYRAVFIQLKRKMVMTLMFCSPPKQTVFFSTIPGYFHPHSIVFNHSDVGASCS